LKEDLHRVLKADGFLILSGILLEREAAFLPAFQAGSPFTVRARLQKDEWVSLLLESTKE
jgi:ribosomal protein L11 methylase PrmA